MIKKDVELTSTWIEVVDTFKKMTLKETLLRGIKDYGFELPAPIQQQVIIPFLIGHKVFVSAQAGTGKSVAIAISLLQKIDTQQNETQAIILLPTRELVQATARMIVEIGCYMDVHVHSCTSRSVLHNDVKTLEQGVHIVMGTPGRIHDYIQHGWLRTDKCKVLIIDEADEIVSRGFNELTVQVFQACANTIQVALYTPTQSTELLEMVQHIMQNPVRF